MILPLILTLLAQPAPPTTEAEASALPAPPEALAGLLEAPAAPALSPEATCPPAGQRSSRRFILRRIVGSGGGEVWQVDVVEVGAMAPPALAAPAASAVDGQGSSTAPTSPSAEEARRLIPDPPAPEGP